MKQILVINGPNLNLLGKRELEIYGTTSLEEIEKKSKEFSKNIKLNIDFKQSNEEAKIISWIHLCVDNKYDGLLINAGAYTNTSIAIMDALNIHQREEFRKKSYISGVANGVIFGFGEYSYILAIMAIENLLKKNNG